MSYILIFRHGYADITSIKSETITLGEGRNSRKGEVLLVDVSKGERFDELTKDLLR